MLSALRKRFFASQPVYATITPVLGLATLVCCSTALAQTVSYTTPGAHSYTVPAGVQAIDVDLAGGGGGGGTGVSMNQGIQGFDGLFPGGNGGNGSKVNARVTVVPGEVIAITVAGRGLGGQSDNGSGTTALTSGAGGAGAGSGGRSADNTSPEVPRVPALYAGGGGGGASAVEMGGAFIRAGGGGGGGSATYGQSWRDVGVPGDAASPLLVNAADCSAPADGQNGVPPPGIGSYFSGGGTVVATGGGGGGGYSNNAGTGGASIAELVTASDGWWKVHGAAPARATGGGSCYHSSSASHTISNTSIGTGALGAVQDPDDLPVFPGGPDVIVALDGEDGWVRITPVAAAAAVQATPVPAMGTGGLIFLALILAVVGRWHLRRSRA